MTRRLALTLALAAVPTAAQAGGWTQRQGSHYVKLTGNRWDTREAFGLAGRLQPLYADEVNRLQNGLDSLGTLTDGRFTDRGLSLYGEIGLFDRVTMLSALSFKQLAVAYRNSDPTVRDPTTGRLLSQADPSRQVERSSTGFGDLLVGVRANLIPTGELLGPALLSVQTTFSLPLSDTSEAVPRSSGGGVGDFRLQLSAGGRLGLPVYVSLEGGYRVHGGPLANAAVYAAEAGVLVAEVFWLRGYADGAVTTATLPERYLVFGGMQTAMSGTAARNQTYHKLTGSFIYKMSPTADVQVDVTRVLAGRATPAGTSLALGIALHSLR